MRIATWKILILVFTVVVCSSLYIHSNGRKLVHEISWIGTSASTTMTPQAATTEATTNYIETEISFMTVSHEEKLKKRFPNAIIIGVNKCGTLALRDMLCSHPVIKCPVRNEINYFGGFFHRGLQWYISTMPETKESELTIEKSQYYKISSAPKRIYDVSKNVKLILIVRNPIARVVSEFTMKNRDIPLQNLSIDDRVLNPDGTIISDASLIISSKYDVYYPRWLEWFDRKQISIVNGDELITNPVPVLHEVETFLNVSHYFESSMFVMNKTKGFYCWKADATVNESNCLKKDKGLPRPTVSNSTLTKLKELLKPHAANFCHLAGVKFDWCWL